MLNILLFSFLVALSGALIPGPLFTFTIYKSLQQKRGYLAGIFIILGHALIELILILGLLAGATLLFKNLVFITIIGIIGGLFLIIFGIQVIKNTPTTDPNIDFSLQDDDVKGYKGNSFLGGIIVSMSNPYWELWWAVIGIGFMARFNISFSNPVGLIFFFIGHELGDIVWYIPISIFISLGGKSLNPKIFKYVLIFCGAFMIVFGLYLCFSIILFPPSV